MGSRQLGLIILKVLDLKSARAMKTMAFADVAGGNTVDIKRHDFTVKHGQDPMQRPNPSQRALTPAHAFRPREVADDIGHDLGQSIWRCPAGLYQISNVKVALLWVRYHTGLGDVG